MITIKKLLPIPTNVWIILFGTFLINAAYWMSWPFLAIILHSKYHLSSSMIGAALSFPLAFSTIFGIYLGNIADKIGRSKIMIIGCFLSFCAYIIFAYAETLSLYMVAIWLANIGRSILEPASKSIFGDIVISENRASCQQLRYFFVNLGAAIGPLCVAYIGLAAKQVTFLITAIAYVIYALLLVLIFISQKNSSTSVQHKNQTSFYETLSILKSDHKFLLLILMNVLLWIVFAQFESSIAIYLSQLNNQSSAKILSIILFTNTMSVITLQFPLLRIVKNLSLNYRISLSIIILAISQLMFAHAVSQTLSAWVAATIIFSIAEVLLVPSISIQIDQMAPDHLRGSYFAASFVYRLGFGAYLGGALMQYVGAQNMYIFMFFIAFMTLLIYQISSSQLKNCNTQEKNREIFS